MCRFPLSDSSSSWPGPHKATAGAKTPGARLRASRTPRAPSPVVLVRGRHRGRQSRGRRTRNRPAGRHRSRRRRSEGLGGAWTGHCPETGRTALRRAYRRLLGGPALFLCDAVESEAGSSSSSSPCVAERQRSVAQGSGGSRAVLMMRSLRTWKSSLLRAEI